MKLIKTTEAVGNVLCHDLTQIIPGVTKDARFRKGHVVSEEDIPVLLSMGKENLYVWEMAPGMLHEDEAAFRLLALCKNDYMTHNEPKEGKIELRADCDGLFTVDVERLLAVNRQDEVMIATRHGNTAVKKGDKLAGMRVIPLVIEEEKIRTTEKAAGTGPLLEIRPWKLHTAAIITTGSEVAKGLVKDAFTPVVAGKLAAFGITVIYHSVVGDDRKAVIEEINKARSNGAELIICTGGMSVDPDDQTPGAIRESGARIIRYGAPVLPGAMLLVGYFDDGTPVMGLPGCVMYAKATIFDLILPRIAAGMEITSDDIAKLGHGGLCLGCGECHYPVCPFGKGE
ncbi:MAG: molybdopterin-binding protein [Oscillospiraceae bacterium]|nr:molybdopterin-binding protein [Oscillospiraceae bacterium]